LPAHSTLVLGDAEFSAAVRRRLLLSCLPRAAPAITRQCGLTVSTSDTEHPLTCDKAQGIRVLRHDDIVDIVRSACRRAGVSTSKEPFMAGVQRAQDLE
jgi:hypothetical protein